MRSPYAITTRIGWDPSPVRIIIAAESLLVGNDMFASALARGESSLESRNRDAMQDCSKCCLLYAGLVLMDQFFWH